MRVFSEKIVAEMCRRDNISSPGSATIMDCAKLSSDLEAETGIPVIHMELGSPGFAPNRIGVEAEKAALDAGVGSKYPPTDGLPVLKEASSRFVKAFLGLDLAPLYHIPTTGSMLGAFGALAAASQCVPGRRKVLVLEPSFSANKQQMAILDLPWKGVEVADLRRDGFEEGLRRELTSGDYAAVMYSNPNNPSWMCLSDSELGMIARVAGETHTIIIEDLAYFCMDLRGRGFGVPYTEPYPPSVSRYTDHYILLLSASKIFSYAGQRIGVMCVGPGLYHESFPALAERYGGSGIFGLTLTGGILDMITSGSTASTQWGLAAMMDSSCEGKLDFVADIAEYGARASRMKEIFLRHGFSISYQTDAYGDIADGFFFTLSYPGMDSATLVEELLAYGVSAVSLDKMGSSRNGVRVCSSRISGGQFELLEERMAAFAADHASD
ncbi:MAG: pyridoxal phosphate-dependent aminotransferase [Bacteroidales bacterium]|nr:pyridoxal phosphate-dependent aminotransferase [Bacteroidales bacterium]